MTLARYAPHIALCATIATLAALCHHHGRTGAADGRTGPPRHRRKDPPTMATARSLLTEALGYTSTDYLDAHWPDLDLTQIADHILTSRDEETLHHAADEYERDQADQYPGAIYGAIRRIRSFKVGAYLRAMADEAAEEPTR